MTADQPAAASAADEELTLDRRQQLAACLLLSAFDVPAPAAAAAMQLLRAAQVCPGVTVDEVPIGNRRACLQRAFDLVEDMLAEIAQ